MTKCVKKQLLCGGLIVNPKQIKNKLLEQKYKKDPSYIKHGDGFSIKENGLIKFFFDGKEVESILVSDGYVVWEVTKVWNKNEWQRVWRAQDTKP